MKWFDVVGFDLGFSKESHEPLVILLLRKASNGETVGLKMHLEQASQFASDFDEKLQQANAEMMSQETTESGLVLPH